MSRKRYLIIGDGAAGTTAAQYIRQGDPSGIIAIYSDDPNPAYFRAALTNYLLGELREDQIWAVPPTFYGELQINRVLARVARVDAARSELWLTSGGRPEPFDYLLVGSGARARSPAFEGATLPGVMTMRTLQDVRRVLDLIKLYGLRRAVVLGGGPLGLEWALGLRARGVEVTLVMREPKFMTSALDGVASDLLFARLKQAGVQVRPGDELRAAMPGRDGRVGAVVTRSGDTIPCELVAVAIGVICNSEFLQGELAIGKSGGVQVDERLRTSAPNIFAAGDIAELGGKLLQLWEPARLQGRAAATNMTAPANAVAYRPGAHYFATRLYDLDFASIGSIAPQPGAEEMVDYPRKTGHISYKKLVIKDGRLIGALMLGEREEKVRLRGKLYKKLIDERVDLSAVRAQLFDATFDLHGWLSTRLLTTAPVSSGGSLRPQPGGPAAKATAAIAAPSKMRGTQALNLSELPPPTAQSAGAPSGTGQLPTGSKMKGTQMLRAPPPTPATGTLLSLAVVEPPPEGTVLSIGLHAALPPTPAAAAESGPAFLEAQGKRWELKGAVTSIGREAEVELTDPEAAHIHAQITRYGESLYLRDLGSASGTWVNGTAVVVPHRLRDGDHIRIGATELVFRSDGARPTNVPPASAIAMSDTPRPRLEVRAGQGLGLTFALATSPTVIGRDPQATIRLDDYSVSWKHAQLREHGGRWYVADLNSGYGTFVNGARLALGKEVPLDEGTALKLGDAQLVFTTRPARAAQLRSPESILPAQAGAPAAVAAPPPRTNPPPATAVPLRRARVTIRAAMGQSPPTELGELVIIGNRPDACNLLVPDPTIAPQHVELTRRPDGYYARDLSAAVGPTFGTFRQGLPLTLPTRLAHGDVLTLGRSVMLLFEESQ